jgi:hypothetical protein
MRSLTNIPYSKEIHEILLEKVKGTQMEIELREAIKFDMLRITPLVECRSKLSDKLMEENGAIKVLGLLPVLVHEVFNGLRIHRSHTLNLIYHTKSKKSAKSWKSLFLNRK